MAPPGYRKLGVNDGHGIRHLAVIALLVTALSIVLLPPLVKMSTWMVTEMTLNFCPSSCKCFHDGTAVCCRPLPAGEGPLPGAIDTLLLKNMSAGDVARYVANTPSLNRVMFKESPEDMEMDVEIAFQTIPKIRVITPSLPCHCHLLNLGLVLAPSTRFIGCSKKGFGVNEYDLNEFEDACAGLESTTTLELTSPNVTAEVSPDIAPTHGGDHTPPPDTSNTVHTHGRAHSPLNDTHKVRKRLRRGLRRVQRCIGEDGEEVDCDEGTEEMGTETEREDEEVDEEFAKERGEADHEGRRRDDQSDPNGKPRGDGTRQGGGLDGNEKRESEAVREGVDEEITDGRGDVNHQEGWRDEQSEHIGGNSHGDDERRRGGQGKDDNGGGETGDRHRHGEEGVEHKKCSLRDEHGEIVEYFQYDEEHEETDEGVNGRESEERIGREDDHEGDSKIELIGEPYEEDDVDQEEHKDDGVAEERSARESYTDTNKSGERTESDVDNDGDEEEDGDQQDGGETDERDRGKDSEDHSEHEHHNEPHVYEDEEGNEYAKDGNVEVSAKDSSSAENGEIREEGAVEEEAVEEEAVEERSNDIGGETKKRDEELVHEGAYKGLHEDNVERGHVENRENERDGGGGDNIHEEDGESGEIGGDDELEEENEVVSGGWDGRQNNEVDSRQEEGKESRVHEDEEFIDEFIEEVGDWKLRIKVVGQHRENNDHGGIKQQKQHEELHEYREEDGEEDVDSEHGEESESGTGRRHEHDYRDDGQERHIEPQADQKDDEVVDGERGGEIERETERRHRQDFGDIEQEQREEAHMPQEEDGDEGVEHEEESEGGTERHGHDYGDNGQVQRKPHMHQGDEDKAVDVDHGEESEGGTKRRHGHDYRDNEQEQGKYHTHQEEDGDEVADDEHSDENERRAEKERGHGYGENERDNQRKLHMPQENGEDEDVDAERGLESERGTERRYGHGYEHEQVHANEDVVMGMPQMLGDIGGKYGGLLGKLLGGLHWKNSSASL